MRALIASASNLSHLTERLCALNVVCTVASDAAGFERALSSQTLNLVMIADDMADLPFAAALRSIIEKQRHAFICGISTQHRSRLFMIRAGADDAISIDCSTEAIETLHARL